MNMNKNEKLKVLAKKAYECANISNDGYTTYPIGNDGVVQVSTIENGKTFNFISPANARKRMERQLLDNKRITIYLPEKFFKHTGAGSSRYYLNAVGETYAPLYFEEQQLMYRSLEEFLKIEGSYIKKDGDKYIITTKDDAEFILKIAE